MNLEGVVASETGISLQAEERNNLPARARQVWSTTRRAAWDTIPWTALIAAMSTIVTSGVTVNLLTGGTFLERYFPAARDRPGTMLLLWVLLFILSSATLYKQRGKFLAVRRLAQHEARAHAGLIILLTSPSLPLERGRDGLEVGGVTLTPGLPLDQAIDAFDDTHNADGRPAIYTWQPLLRAVLPHARTLRHVYLIGSTATGRFRSSFEVRHEAETLIRPYLPNRATLQSATTAVDFEDLDALLKAIQAAVDSLCRRGLRPSDITVDVTGGPKTASIAGAVFTLNSQITFQYVQTDGLKKAIEFDLEVQAPSLA